MHHHWGQLQHEPMDSKYYWVPSKWKYFVCIWVYEYMHMCKGNRASECVAAWMGLADRKAHRVQWHILPLISVHRHLLRTQRKPLYFFLLRKGDPKPTFALSGTGWIMLLGPCRDPCKPYVKLELLHHCLHDLLGFPTGQGGQSRWRPVSQDSIQFIFLLNPWARAHRMTWWWWVDGWTLLS